jgi:ATP-dependent Lon protease
LHKYFKASHPNAVDFIEQQDIHIHFPEGAVKKDGPSAGITITSSLVGLALGRSTIDGLGMTGEISLNGKVLKIGGVKEKTMAAAREGLKTLIFPAANKKEVLALPEFIT